VSVSGKRYGGAVLNIRTGQFHTGASEHLVGGSSTSTEHPSTKQQGKTKLGMTGPSRASSIWLALNGVAARPRSKVVKDRIDRDYPSCWRSVTSTRRGLLGPTSPFYPPRPSTRAPITRLPAPVIRRPPRPIDLIARRTMQEHQRVWRGQGR
jgi:hypothetical protein